MELLRSFKNHHKNVLVPSLIWLIGSRISSVTFCSPTRLSTTFRLFKETQTFSHVQAVRLFQRKKRPDGMEYRWRKKANGWQVFSESLCLVARWRKGILYLIGFIAADFALNQFSVDHHHDDQQDTICGRSGLYHY